MNLRGGTRVTQWKQQKGHRVRIGGGDAREGIFRSRAGLHGEDADSMTVGDPAEAVRDSDSHSFLTADDRADAGRGGRLDQRVGGITTQKFDSFALEDFTNSVDDSHKPPPKS